MSIAQETEPQKSGKGKEVKNEAKPVISRRKWLKRVGVGAGATLILVSGAGVWRAADQGLFNMGQGVAYKPWTNWKTDKAEGLLQLVRAGILAANTHNSQPWLFRISENRIDLLADLNHAIPANDPSMRELYISLGCALENTLLAAEANGYNATVALMPDPATPTYAARIDLAPGTTTPNELYQAIPNRHTNRFAYDLGKPIKPETLATMQALSKDANVKLFWLTTSADHQKFSQLTLEATEIMNADKEQALETHNWTRLNDKDIEKHSDGLTMETTGLSDLMIVLGKMMPPPSIEEEGQYWLNNTRDIQLATAATFGLISVRDNQDRSQQIQAGQLWQKLHLWATLQGMAMQPLDQIPQRADREKQLNLPPHFAPALQELVADPQWKGVLSFRAGYPTKPGPAPSPRHLVESVLAAK